MKAQPECMRCFMRQADHAARLAGLDANAGDALFSTLKQEMAQMPEDQNPAITASWMHARIRTLSASPDPYREKKQEATAHALALYPQLKRLLAESSDPLATAVRLAIASGSGR